MYPVPAQTNNVLFDLVKYCPRICPCVSRPCPQYSWRPLSKLSGLLFGLANTYRIMSLLLLLDLNDPLPLAITNFDTHQPQCNKTSFFTHQYLTSYSSNVTWNKNTTSICTSLMVGLCRTTIAYRGSNCPGTSGHSRNFSLKICPTRKH